MADLSVRFHALPAETARFIEDIAADPAVCVLHVKWRPFSIEALPRHRITAELEEIPEARIVLVEGTPKLRAASESQFLELNPTVLIVDIGGQGPNGLKESFLGCRVPNAGVPERWRKAAKKLRDITTAGATAYSADRSASSFLKDHRFSPGAAELQARGVPILPIAGTSQFHLGAVDSDVLRGQRAKPGRAAQGAGSERDRRQRR